MNVLIFAPHRDDEIIGVGGTLLKRKLAGDTVTVCVVTAREGQELPPSTQILHKQMKDCHEYCNIDKYIGLPYAANDLENVSRKDLNKAIFDVIVSSQADEVYLPFWGDMQKDHQIVTEAAMVALREKYNHPVKRIYAYETLSETGINLPTESLTFIPNVYEDISEVLDQKLEAMSFYKSQVHPFPDLRSLEAIKALAKFRGATVNVSSAEAFVLIRETK